jgi:hypothetical protein
MKFYEFKEDDKRVDIFNERWYRHPETGKFYRNVTTILGIVSKGYNYDEWLKNNGHNAEIIMDRAGRFGTEFHKLVELFLHGETVKYYDLTFLGDKTATDLWERFNLWIDFWKELNKKYKVEYKPQGIEYITYSEKHGYAGTIDLVCRLDDELVIMDWKTGNHLGQKEELQMTAYMDTIGCAKAMLIHLPAEKPNKKGYKIKEVSYTPEMFDLFLSIKKVFEANNTDEPKVLSLPLEINKEEL